MNYNQVNTSICGNKMKTIKLTPQQYLAIRKPLPVRHIACQPRETTTVVSEYTRRTAYVQVHNKLHS